MSRSKKLPASAAAPLGSAAWLRALANTKESIRELLGPADDGEGDREDKREIAGLNDSAAELDRLAQQSIEWHYCADKLPDDEVTVLVAFNASGQPAGAFLQAGVWRYDNGSDVIRSVYAWLISPRSLP